MRYPSHRLGDVLLAVNLDGVGFREGRDAYSRYGGSGELAGLNTDALGAGPGLCCAA